MDGTVGRNEDDLEGLSLALQLVVGFAEDRGESAAGRAPVSRKVDAQVFALELLSIDGTLVGDQAVADGGDIKLAHVCVSKE